MWPSSAELDALENKPLHETDPTAKARSSIRRRPAVRHSPNARDGNRLSANARTMRALHAQMQALDRDFDSLTSEARRRLIQNSRDTGPPRLTPFQNLDSHDVDIADILRQVPNLPDGIDPSSISNINITFAGPAESHLDTVGAPVDRPSSHGHTPPTPPDMHIPELADMPPLQRVSASNRRHHTPYARASNTLTPGTANGLGDRSRSFSPADDTDPHSWRNLFTTIRPDEHLPSASSSFAASASSALSSFTSDGPVPDSSDNAAHREVWICEDSDSGMEEEGVSRIMRRASRTSSRRPRDTVILRYGRRGLPLNPPSAVNTTQFPANRPTETRVPDVSLPSPGPLSPSHPEHHSFAARHRRLQEREAALRRLNTDLNLAGEQHALTVHRYPDSERARVQRLYDNVTQSVRHQGDPETRRADRAINAMMPLTTTATNTTTTTAPPPHPSSTLIEAELLVQAEESNLIAWEARIQSRIRALSADRLANRLNPETYIQLLADIQAMPHIQLPFHIPGVDPPDPNFPDSEQPQREVTDRARMRSVAERRRRLLEEVERAIQGGGGGGGGGGSSSSRNIDDDSMEVRQQDQQQPTTTNNNSTSTLGGDVPMLPTDQGVIGEGGRRGDGTSSRMNWETVRDMLHEAVRTRMVEVEEGRARRRDDGVDNVGDWAAREML